MHQLLYMVVINTNGDVRNNTRAKNKKHYTCHKYGCALQEMCLSQLTVPVALRTIAHIPEAKLKFHMKDSRVVTSSRLRQSCRTTDAILSR